MAATVGEMTNSQGNIAIFDGDNTLWDTNEVFTEAQMNVLRGLKQMGFPADADRDFTLLRRIDDVLIRYFGKREYDIAFLPLCLMRHYRGEEVSGVDRVSNIIETNDETEFVIARKLGAEFTASLRRIPKLFSDVVDVLAAVRRKGRTILILYSEGKESRLRRICDHYGLSEYFHRLVIRGKSLEDWKWVKQEAIEMLKAIWPGAMEEPEIYVIGDLLETDIKPGNLIGAVTIYKPGGYKGMETPTSNEETPILTISSMKEILTIL